MKEVPILVLDFGSQYTQLIARKLRESGVYCEIVPYNEKIEDIKKRNPKGIILSVVPHRCMRKTPTTLMKRCMHWDFRF